MTSFIRSTSWHPSFLWQSDPGDGSLTVPVSVIDQGDETELVTIRAAPPLGDSAREFIRLKVSS